MSWSPEIVDVLISGAVALVMYGLGLSLSRQDYLSLVAKPKPVLVGLFGQMLALPLMMIGLMLLLPISPEYKIGFVILAACPGGSTSGLITFLLGGEVAMSLSLTVANSLLALATIPFLVNLAFLVFGHQEVYIEMPLARSMAHIFLVTIVPVFLGGVTRKLIKQGREKLQRPLKIAMIIILSVVFTIKFFAGEHSGGAGILKDELLLLLPLSFGVNTLAFLIGLAVARLGNLNRKRSMTAAIEIAVQNSSLAMLITGTLLQNQEMLKPSLVYAIISFWTTFILAFLYKSRSASGFDLR